MKWIAGLTVLVMAAVTLPLWAKSLVPGVTSPAVEAVPTLAGIHRRPWNQSLTRLDVLGIRENEYFISGAVGTDAQPYRTRVLVRTPTDPKRFNGRVIVEWVNVTGGRDLEIAGPLVRDLVARHGYALVVVSAQPIGVAFLKRWDPVRYASLRHPAIPDGPMPPFIFEDAASDGIFDQIGYALRAHGKELFGSTPRFLIATGQSQSSMRLVQYINTLATTSRAYDGYLLINGLMSPISNSSSKVIAINSEFEVDLHVRAFNGDKTFTGSAMPKVASPEMQPDSDNLRVYDIAGVGHTPVPSLREMKALNELNPAGMTFTSCKHGEQRVPGHYVIQNAFVLMDNWIADGTTPPHAARMAIVVGTDGRASIDRDQYGNAKGGIRLPQQDFPLGQNYGLNEPYNLMCSTLGGFEPFDDAALKKLLRPAS